MHFGSCGCIVVYWRILVYFVVTALRLHDYNWRCRITHGITDCYLSRGVTHTGRSYPGIYQKICQEVLIITLFPTQEIKKEQFVKKAHLCNEVNVCLFIC